MMPAIFVLVFSFALAYLLTPVARRLALRVGLVDRPDGGRKTQREPMPVAGGLVVLLAVLVALATVWLLPDLLSGQEEPNGRFYAGFLAACLGICGLGVADDLGRLRGRQKLAGQMAIVILVIWSGVEVRQIHCFVDFDLGLMSLPFTAFLLLGAINSLNLIDGMDGLLSSVGAIICLTLGALAALGGHWPMTIITLAMAGALLGFLRYNFPPASIYLGDAGSMLVGLVVGVLAIRSSLKGPATVALAVPVAVLAIPIFDTTAAILRRTLTGRSIYTTDRGHLHHCLLRKGLGTRWTLLLISGFCLISALGALGSAAFKNEMFAIVTSVGVIGVLIVGRVFGHAELSLVFKRLTALGSSLTNFPSWSNGRGYEAHLQGVVDWSKLWADLHSRFEEFSLKSVQLDVNVPAVHENYHASWNQPLPTDDQDSASTWRAEIPLTLRGRAFGRLSLSGCRDGRPEWQKIALLVQLSEEFAASNHLYNGVAVDLAHANPVPAPRRTKFGEPKPVATVGN